MDAAIAAFTTASSPSTPDGAIANHHRKLRPTYTEQLVWAPGDGAGLRAVDTAAGRVGGLICWEHWMPQARQAMHISNEAIHVALWPAVKESHQIASRHYAFARGARLRARRRQRHARFGLPVRA